MREIPGFGNVSSGSASSALGSAEGDVKKMLDAYSRAAIWSKAIQEGGQEKAATLDTQSRNAASASMWGSVIGGLTKLGSTGIDYAYDQGWKGPGGIADWKFGGSNSSSSYSSPINYDSFSSMTSNPYDPSNFSWNPWTTNLPLPSIKY